MQIEPRLRKINRSARQRLLISYLWQYRLKPQSDRFKSLKPGIIEIMKLNNIPVVDLFAGPGGLGEGFSSVKEEAFKILVSAEKDPPAHQTLRLRAYYRLLLREAKSKLNLYLDYCNGVRETPWDESTYGLWLQAEVEAQLIELGSQDGNAKLDNILQQSLPLNDPWVLIGGPPCQAYSLVGRSRNKGKLDYKPENDNRHFLYREYLRIIQKYRPAIFVMENVKGILSAKVNGEPIFHSILKDLSDPDSAIGSTKSKSGYRLFSLVNNVEFKRGDSPNSINPHDFVIRAEEYGIPQARHRVIILGVREGIALNSRKLLGKAKEVITVEDVIGELPALRSRMSKDEDSNDLWAEVVSDSATYLSTNSLDKNLQHELKAAQKFISCHKQTGGLRVPRDTTHGSVSNKSLNDWYKKYRPAVWLNHETRGHMKSDLLRYLFAAAFAKAHSYSPKGAEEFNIKGLRPAHKNWETGHFSDRFRVQLSNRPATTVTSHISKDGHYFIHYDPSQCRSLTVREAARLQTFPDNYFFQGNRTQQYHQVGNAVPPYLAKKIAEIVYGILNVRH